MKDDLLKLNASPPRHLPSDPGSLAKGVRILKIERRNYKPILTIELCGRKVKGEADIAGSLKKRFLGLIYKYLPKSRKELCEILGIVHESVHYGGFANLLRRCYRELNCQEVMGLKYICKLEGNVDVEVYKDELNTFKLKPLDRRYPEIFFSYGTLYIKKNPVQVYEITRAYDKVTIYLCDGKIDSLFARECKTRNCKKHLEIELNLLNYGIRRW